MSYYENVMKEEIVFSDNTLLEIIAKNVKLKEIINELENDKRDIFTKCQCLEEENQYYRELLMRMAYKGDSNEQ